MFKSGGEINNFLSMHLKKLSLINYKNHQSSIFEFNEGINCVTGLNGSGKTNLLDSIYFIALTKSATSSQVGDAIFHDAEFATIKAKLISKSDITIVANVFKNKKKVFRINDTEYERLLDHIGVIPVILIEPNDVDYVRMGSELRRKLFDGFISQLDSEYLSYIIRYNRTLKQRNSLLKNASETGQIDETLLDVFDDSIVEASDYIYRARKSFIGSFIESQQKIYAIISEQREEVDIQYESEYVEGAFARLLKQKRKQDIKAQRTTVGIHRDDFNFLFKEESRSVKQFGSQGQQKTFILSLKLAQIYLFKSKLKVSPILLLDDIFDKLDGRRIHRLVEFLISEKVQVIITDARKERTNALMSEIGVEASYIDL